MRERDSALFAFESKAWKSAIRHEIMLEKVQRQSDDTFVTMLNQIRIGHLATRYRRILEERISDEPHRNSTKVFCTRKAVASENYRRVSIYFYFFFFPIFFHLLL